MFSVRVQFLPIFIFFGIFPFFEGLETASGLFLSHTLTLVSFCCVILFQGKLWLPPYFKWFIPFLFALILSAIIAPYKFSAFLGLWDYWIAAFYAVCVYSLLKQNQDSLETVTSISFVIGTVSTLLSVLLIPNPYFRWSGSFVSPLDFGIFCLLLFVLGLFCFERAASNRGKITISACLIFLVVCIAMASSRAVFLATLVMLGYYLWKKRSSRMISIFLILALVGSAIVIYVRLFHFSDPYQYYRFKIWKYSLQGILQDPYLGIGLNMLPYRAATFNFPSEQEVGRFSRIAASADSQYLQILIETGFVGFFLFLIGWIGLYFGLRKLPPRFLAFRGAYIILTITLFFILPLMNTSILFLFIFLVLFPLPFDPEAKQRSLTFHPIFRILFTILSFGIFLFAVFFPYRADREFNAYINSHNSKEAEKHLKAAISLNPFQPYYGFTNVRQIVDALPELEPAKWLSVARRIDHFIELNPLETDFYAYKAKIFRIMLQKTGKPAYYSEAVSYYQSAIQNSPFNVFLRAEYAFFEARTGHLSSSESELNEILRLEPAYLDARLLLAEVLYKSGKHDLAQKQFYETERLNRRYASVRHSVNEPYVRKLLQLNHSYMNQVKKLIFDVPKSEAQ